MSTKKAEDIYIGWHEKNPKKFETKKVSLLDEPYFCAIGHAVEITYKSDKWEEDGNWHLYVHDFTSRPKVYLPERHVSEDEQLGRPVKTKSLLGSKALKNQLQVAFLATAVEFTLKDKDGENLELKLGRGAKMYSTPDAKSLLILTKAGPVIVRGGEMRVTSRGIVK